MKIRQQIVLATIVAPIIAFALTFPTATGVHAEGASEIFLPFVSANNSNSSGAAETPSVPAPPPVRDSRCDSSNSNEIALANLITNDSGQQRDFMVCNSTLAQVARERAIDMATRNYFGHTNPDGIGPNTLVRNAGYPLPGFYTSSRDGNNIESIAAGYQTVQEAYNGWLGSSGHRVQVLGEEDFYRQQVEYGVGYYYDANSEYKHYWVFLSAYQE